MPVQTCLVFHPYRLTEWAEAAANFFQILRHVMKSVHVCGNPELDVAARIVDDFVFKNQILAQVVWLGYRMTIYGS
jgi:hypothetical protein